MPGSFDQVMETARRLAVMRGQYRNLSFLFNATINNVNWRELPELAKYVRDQFEANLDFNLLSGNPRDSAIALPGQKDLEWTVNGIAASYRTTTLEASRLKVCHDVILRTNAEGRQIIPCRGGSIIAMVDANGDVRSCPMLPVLGNLRHDSFRKIWRGSLAKTQHRMISRGGCSCNFDCLIVSSLNHYWKFPLLVLQQQLTNLLGKP